MDLHIFEKKKRYAVLWLALLPAGAMASDADCIFTQECFEGEACVETDYALTLSQNGTTWNLETIAETVPVAGDVGPGAVFVSGQTDTAMHMLTADPNGDARYTLHMQGPLAITYQGTCEVAQ